MSVSLKRLKWLALLLFLAPMIALSTYVMVKTSNSELELLNQIVFPGSVNAVIKWPKAVRFAIATDNEEDAALALKVMSDIVDSLPGRSRDKIIFEKRAPLIDVPSLKEHGVIYVSSRPLEDLTGPLRPFFETLIADGDDVDQRIDQLRSQAAPWQTTIRTNNAHEVVGMLVMIRSSTDLATKRLMLAGAAAQVVCPATLLGKSDPVYSSRKERR